MKLHTIVRLSAVIASACLLSLPAPAAGEPSSVPSSVSASQTAAGARLKSIAFGGASLSTPLTPEETAYRLVCTVAPDSVSFQGCETVDPDAKVNVVRRYHPEEGADVFEVTVSGAGQSSAYTFLLPQNWEGVSRQSADNALLSSLSFSHGELSPSFQSGRTSYQLYLPSDVTGLTVNAAPANSKSTVNAPREIRLKAGQEMKIIVNVTAPDGVTANSYTVKIKRIKKTMAQVEELKKDPNFKGLVNESATAHPGVIIAVSGTLAAALLAAGFLFWYRRRQNPSLFHHKIKPKSRQDEEK